MGQVDCLLQDFDETGCRSLSSVYPASLNLAQEYCLAAGKRGKNMAHHTGIEVYALKGRAPGIA